MKKLKSLFRFAEMVFILFTTVGCNNPSVAKDWVNVKGGTFVRKGYNVTVGDFVICNHEVTQSEYLEIMRINPSNNSQNLENPVECVRWVDSVYYCNRRSIAEGLKPCYIVNGDTDPEKWNYTPHNDDVLDWNITCDFTANGYRLPTEAEWEFAARGGNKSKSYQYSGSNKLDEVAWYVRNSNDETHPVKTKSPNELGIYDMSGNVWEWCWDFYDSYPQSNQENPYGPSTGDSRVARGAAFHGLSDWCEIANLENREEHGPQYYNDRGGFRVVRSSLK